MSTTNTKKNSMINTSSVTNDKKKKGIADYYSSSFKNKIKSSLTQKKVSSTNSELNSNLNQINTNSFLWNNYNKNYTKNNNNNNIEKKSTNQDLINRLKNKSSSLKFSITSKNYYINMKNKTKNVNSFKLEEEPNNIDIKKNIINQDFTKGINILNKFDTFAHEMKYQTKDKNKFNKTVYNYYFDKSKNLKNTKSFDVNSNVNLKDKKEKEKATIIIDTEKNIERKINKNRSKNEEIVCIDKVEINNNIDKENDKNQINIINNNKNEEKENKKEEISRKENKEEKEEIKNVNNDKDSMKLNENINKEIVKKEKEKTNINEKDKPEKMRNFERVSKDKEQINIKKEEINKNKNKDIKRNEKIDGKINEKEEIKKIDKKNNKNEEIKKVNDNKENKDNNKKEDIKENEEIKKLDDNKENKDNNKKEEIKGNKEKEKIEIVKENKDKEKIEKSKENKEKEKVDDNKENKDNNKKEENNEKDKKEIKYSSPVKKNKSKKKKKYSQECTSNTPIIIQFKPLSPKHGEIPIKDPDDLVPIYFNTSTINNIQIPKDYLNVIYYNLLNEEKINRKNFKAEYNYMNNQKEITEQMRSILIDWIIDVHGKFGFCDETLYMTISIIDRYSSIKKITRNEYQCLGITALMISCKHEEINVPKVEDFIYITDNAYTKQEVFNMEIDILDKLKYNLLYPSPIKFYEYLSLHFGFDKKKHFLGKYLMETFLLNLICIKFKPSIISCACIYIVMKFFKMKNYKESYLKKWYMIEGKEGFELENGCGIKDCAQEMCNFVDNIGSTKYLSCQKKYSADDYCNISKLIVNYPENNNNKKEDKKEDNKKE